MRSFFKYAALAAAVVSLAAADPSLNWEADEVRFHKRQKPDAARLACINSCDLAVSLATGDHCENREWRGSYEACLECANTFGIWEQYDEAVSRAGRLCDLDTEPSPSPPVATITETFPATPLPTDKTTATGPPATEPPLPSGSESSPPETESTPPPEETTGHTTAPPASETGPTSTPEPTTSTVPGAASSLSSLSAISILGLALLFVML